MNVIIGLYVLVGKNKKIKYCINNFFRIFLIYHISFISIAMFCP